MIVAVLENEEDRPRGIQSFISSEWDWCTFIGLNSKTKSIKKETGAATPEENRECAPYRRVYDIKRH